MSNKKFLYETHMHTFESSWCSFAGAKEHVRIYKDRGYTGIIITDHLSTENFRRSRFKHGKPLLTWKDKVDFLMRGYEKAKEEGEKIGLDVFFGWELYAGGSEFLTYGLGREFLLKYKDLDKMALKEYSEIVRENGGYLAQAHPYRAKAAMAIPTDTTLIDGVEIYNASRTHKGDENAKAIVFAREHDLAIQAGTDAHFPDLKLYSGVMLEKRAENIFDIINAIKQREIEPILQPKEKALLYGNIDDARKVAQAEEVPELLVKVFYDCKHAREVAEELCAYIEEHMGFDAVCDHMDNYGKNEKHGKLTKTIIIGHHSEAKAKFEYIKTNQIQYQKYGMRYRFDNSECVLIASKSKLEKNKGDKSVFFNAFNDRFDEKADDIHLRKAQFKYIVMEFMQNGLRDFLNAGL